MKQMPLGLVCFLTKSNTTSGQSDQSGPPSKAPSSQVTRLSQLTPEANFDGFPTHLGSGERACPFLRAGRRVIVRNGALDNKEDELAIPGPEWKEKALTGTGRLLVTGWIMGKCFELSSSGYSKSPSIVHGVSYKSVSFVIRLKI